jgi:hypothetical protein
MPRKRKTTVTLEAKRVHYKTNRAQNKTKLLATPINKGLIEFSGLSEQTLKWMKKSNPGMFATAAAAYSDHQKIVAFRRTLTK